MFNDLSLRPAGGAVRCFALPTLCCFAAVLLLISWAGIADAQNLVPNPNLATQLAPWGPFLSAAPDPTGSGAAPVWVASPDMIAGGSALIDINTSAPATDAASGIAQCFDFVAPTSVSFVNYGVSFLVPASTSADESLSATVEIRLFANAGCTGFITGGSQGQTLAPGMSSDTTWYTLNDSGFVPPGAPVMVASVQMRGYLRQTGIAPTQTGYQANLDHFFLMLNGTTPVRLLHFDVD